MQLTIVFGQQVKQFKMNAETKQTPTSEIYLMIILTKLAFLCILKLLKMCGKVYKKHNEVVLKNNFTRYIDVEKGVTPVTPAMPAIPSTSAIKNNNKEH